jgi:hypothetical protein
VRRRQRTPPGFVEPPGRLLSYVEADWLPLVDPAGYDPESYRNRGPDGPYGPPNWSFEAWRGQQAWNLFSRARLNWRDQYGWPGGLDLVELLQQTVRMRQAQL